MPDRLRPRSAVLDALGHLEAVEPPGSAISIEAVAGRAGLDKDAAIRIGLELMEAGQIDGRSLRGDGRVMTINGLSRTGAGRGNLQHQRSLQFMLELERRGAGRSIEEYATTIGEALGWSQDETDAVAETLTDDHLLDEVELGSDLVRISPQGRLMLNDAVQDHATPGAPLPSIVNIFGDVTGSQIQAGTVDSSQQQLVLSSQSEAVSAFIGELGRLLPDLGLGGEDLAAARADVASVESQLASPRPNEGVLRASLHALRPIVEGVAGNAAFAGLVELFHHIRL